MIYASPFTFAHRQLIVQKPVGHLQQASAAEM